MIPSDPAPPGAAPRRHARIQWSVQAATLVLAAVWVFSPVFRGGWLWDDDDLRRNAALRTLRGLRETWFAPAGFDYYPLKDTVQWLQWHLWGDDAPGYHLTNVALHVLGGLLLWRVFRRLGVPLAWLGALIFVIHPLTVGSVAWISELKNVLSLPFLLLAFDSWLGHCDGPSPIGAERARSPGRLNIPALAWFTAAMLCKSSVVMFPCVLLLHAWWRRGRITRTDLAATAPFFLISLVLGLVTVRFQQTQAIHNWPLAMGGFPARAAGAGRAAVFYLGKCAWPANLLPIYPRWPANPPSPVQFIPLLGLGAATAVLWANRRSWGRHALFGLGSFLLFLAPVLGFVPMSFFTFSFVADHLVYLPLAGLAGLAAAGLSAATARAPRTLRPWVLAGLALAVCAPLAVQGRRHAGIFRSEEALWFYALGRDPRSWAAHNNLATALARDPGRQAEAILHYEAAIRLNPGFVWAHNGLGTVLAGIPGRQSDAVARYEAALRLQPDFVQARYNLATLLAGMGRKAEAIAHYETVLRLKPDFAQAHNNLATLLAGTGRKAEAVSHFETALRLQPDSTEAHNNMANLLAEMGRKAEAVSHYETAIRLNPDFAQAHGNLADLLTGMGRLPEAIAQYREALRLNPGFPEGHGNLGVALARSGRLPEAIGEFEEALRIKPGAAGVHYNLGVTLQASGRISEANAQFGEARRLQAASPGAAH